MEKKEELSSAKVVNRNAKSYSMKLFFSKELFEDFKPNYQLPILIVRLQGVVDHLFAPKMSVIYVFDFGKVQKLHSGHGVLNFVASEFSISLIFPESFSSNRAEANLPDVYSRADSGTYVSSQDDFVIEFSVSETYEMFFMALIYFVIVSVFLIFIGFLCLSTAALCARRLDIRGGNHPLNLRIIGILERIRARNMELRNIIHNDHANYETMVERKMVNEVLYKKTKLGEGRELYELGFNQKECNVCFTAWVRGSKVAISATLLPDRKSVV